MLENNEKCKIEDYINNLIMKIEADASNDINAGVADKEVIDRTVHATVNKFTPESKMILSSVYTMLMEKTLSEDFFNDPQNRAKFHSEDILGALNSHFSFTVPDHIDYEESLKLLNKWSEAGAVTIIGGIISIRLKSIIPIAIATVIAGIMLYLLKNQNISGSKENVRVLISKYLQNVKTSLMSWVDEISDYYDKRIEGIKKGV